MEVKKLFELIPSFPRELSVPERINCLTEKEFYDKVNIYNGIKQRIYFGVYDNSGKDKNYTKSNIHVIPFDLDSDNSLDNIKKLVKYCWFNDFRHTVIFSTGGFWIYVKTKNTEGIKNKKFALKNCQMGIARELELTVGMDVDEFDIDGHIIGDIKRVARMPGSYDSKRNLYCIGVSLEDIDKGLEYIKERAKTQSNKLYWYCNGGVNLKSFDYIPELIRPDFKEYKYVLKSNNNLLDKCIPCVREHILETPLKGHNKFWVYICIYLKERWAMSSEQIKSLVKPYLLKHKRTDGQGENDFEHFIIYDDLPNSVIRSGYYMLECDKLFEMGFCKGKCEFYNKQGIYDVL